jgi:hypothetical protein
LSVLAESSRLPSWWPGQVVRRELHDEWDPYSRTTQADQWTIYKWRFHWVTQFTVRRRWSNQRSHLEPSPVNNHMEFGDDVFTTCRILPTKGILPKWVVLGIPTTPDLAWEIDVALFY